MAQCPREACFWPDVRCHLGHLDHSQCPVLEAGSTGKPDGGLPPDTVALPWSGGVLGLADLGFIAGRLKPTVLAIMGPQNAGKTTLLAAWYLLLGRGAMLDNELRFSGSWSLAGWEAVASSLRWEPGSIAPTFPPHTSSRGTRVPGLLHLAFDRAGDQRRDYVMTDAPGEWFRSWAVNRAAPDAEGARWAAEHADAFLLVADREALGGPERGAAHTDIQLLARRLAAERRGRPVALVWTQLDVPLHDDAQNTVRSTVCRALAPVVEFAVSIVSSPNGPDTGRGLVDLLRWTLNVQRTTVRLPERAAETLDPLFMIRAR